MKKIGVMAIAFLMMLLFVSCSENKKLNYDIKISEKISPYTPLKIYSNFEYEKINISLDSSPVNNVSSPDTVYLKNYSDGIYNIKVDFFDYSDKLLTTYSTNIYYDNIPPVIESVEHNINKGKINFYFNIKSIDFKNIKTFVNDEEYSDSSSEEIQIPISKYIKDINYKFLAYDDAGNYTEYDFSVDTTEDSSPVIVSKNLKMNIFSEYSLDIEDDYDRTTPFYIKEKDSFLYPYELLAYNDITKATVTAVDSYGNSSEKLVDVFKDKTFPDKVYASQRLIPKDQEIISWRLDNPKDRYVIESLTDNFGFKDFLETDLSFVNTKDYDFMFVRKKTSNGTLGLPSPPIIRFSDLLMPYASGILEDIEDNTLLNQINSPYIVANDILVDKDKILFVESGTELLFYSDSRMIIRGTLFIMPGAATSLISGNGNIFLDGGNIIISNTNVSGNINFSGKSGKIVFIENSKFEKGVFNFENLSRFIFYSNDFSKGTITLKNSFDAFFDYSRINTLSINNSNEVLIKSSFINTLSSDSKTRIGAENLESAKINLNYFDYFYGYKCTLNEVSLKNFSSMILNESKLNLSEIESGVLKKDDRTQEN